MKKINISGQDLSQDKQPPKDVWYKDLVIIIFLTMMLYYMVFGEIQIM